MTECPSDKTLVKYLQGELDDARNALAETHVEACPHCAARLDQMGDVYEVAELRDRLGDAYGSPEIALPQPVAPNTIGRLGRFDVETKLGSGGMGVVYRAFDTTLKRPVAIKVIRPELACVTGFRNLFAREAETAASVRNDYVVGIHHVESSFTPDSPSYLVMEWVEGENLKNYLDRRKKQNEKVTVRTAAKIAWEIARGLAAIHAKGLIHRDIKPANILLDKTARRARITDFGLARPIDGSEERVTLTTGAVGTPEYMSPEQFTDPRAVDGLSDLYSTGVVLYEMLTGQTPFSGSSPHQLAQQVPVAKPKAPRALDPKIPIELETICLACLDKEKEHRFADAGALADDLPRFMNHEPILKKRPTLQRRMVLFERRHRPLLRFAASFLVLAVLLVGFIFVQRGQIATVFEAKRKADENASNAKAFGARQSNLAGEKTKEAALRKDREEFTRYISDMKEAYIAWDGNAMDEMRILLERQIPRAGAKDWRGAEWYYLDDLASTDHQTPEFQGFVRDARFSPDGARMAALVKTRNPNEYQVHIWKFTSIKPERTLVLDRLTSDIPDMSHPGLPITGPENLAFSHDGTLIAATERFHRGEKHEGLVKVWETHTGTEMFSASDRGIAGRAVIFTPDGRYVIAGGYNNAALVWELPGGKLRWTLLGGNRSRAGVAWA
jgi:Protein kinase domain